MIMISVGTQFSFDRLVSAVDKWAKDKTNLDFFAQIGKSDYQAESFEGRAFVGHDEFTAAFDKADFIVSHAGMGNIIRALEQGKPIVIMPRLSSLGEHRNDHQVGTARAFSGKAGVYLAESEEQLGEVLDRVLSSVADGTIGIPAELNCHDLVSYLEEVIDS